MMFASCFKSVRQSFKKYFLFVEIVSGVQYSVVASQSVSVAWDASNDASVAGYMIHYGTQSGVYTSSVDVGNVTTASIQLPEAGQTYYIVATCYDAEGNESGYSNETTVTPGSTSTTTPTVNLITAPGFSENGHFGLTVAGIPGAHYVIQASTNLLDWVPVHTNTSPFVYVDAGSGNYSQRFYRPVAL